MRQTKMLSGAWLTACVFGATMRSCSIYMTQPHFGETRFSPGLVRPQFILAFTVLSRMHNLDDPNDAFWLAQTYFMTHRYSRAERLLTRPFSTKPPAVPFDLKGKAREPDFPPRLPVGPAAMIDIAAEQQEGVSRLVDMSVVCRYLAAQCLVRQGKWAEATEMLGEANPFRNSGASVFRSSAISIH